MDDLESAVRELGKCQRCNGGGRLTVVDQDETYVKDCGDCKGEGVRPQVGAILTSIAAVAQAERDRVAARMRREYPLNAHAREWADWIEREGSGT